MHFHILHFELTFSQFLWELTSQASSAPPYDVVKMWIDRLSGMLGVSVYYSKHVINSLVVQAKKLCTRS